MPESNELQFWTLEDEAVGQFRIEPPSFNFTEAMEGIVRAAYENVGLSNEIARAARIQSDRSDALTEQMLQSMWRVSGRSRGYGAIASEILSREVRRKVEVPASHRQPLILGSHNRTPQPIIQIKDEGEITQRRAIWNAWKSEGFTDDCYAVTAAKIERERQLHI